MLNMKMKEKPLLPDEELIWATFLRLSFGRVFLRFDGLVVKSSSVNSANSVAFASIHIPVKGVLKKS